MWTKFEIAAIVFSLLLISCSGAIEKDGENTSSETILINHHSTIISETSGPSTDNDDSTNNDDSTDSTDNTPNVLTGVLIDSPIGGVDYTTPTQSGTTDTNGQYQYISGETISFSVGGVKIENVDSLSAQSQTTLLDLAGVTDETDPTVVNMAVFFQSLDDNGSATDGITITDATKTQINALNITQLNFDMPIATYQTQLANSISALTASNSVVRSDVVNASEALHTFKEGGLNNDSNGSSAQESAPIEITLSNKSIEETTSLNTIIGNLASTSTFTGKSLTSFSLTHQSLSGAFAVSTTGVVTVANTSAIDFDVLATTSNFLIVKVIDNDVTDLTKQSFEQAFTVTITGVNESPLGMTLSSASIAENSASGTEIGTLSLTGDPDSGDTAQSFALVSGTGDTDNGSFSISGNKLSSAASFDFESAASKSIRIQGTDLGGNTVTSVQNILVTDVAEQSLIAGALQGFELSLSAAVSTFAGSAGSFGSIEGTGSSARFNNPRGITTDGTNLYVTDVNNNSIRKIVIATGAVTTLAGSAMGSGADDGTGSGARFNSPRGVTTDGTNVYVADTGNHTIRKIVIATKEVTTLAGNVGNTGTDDGIGTNAKFNLPERVTTDGTNLYVVDTNNHTVRKIVIATKEVTTLAGNAGSSGTDDGSGTSAKFLFPSGLTTDGTNLYVADTSNHTIRKIVIATGAVTTLAGNAGNSGTDDGTGTNAKFSSPVELTTDGTNLYVTDIINHTIRKIVIATGVVTTLAGDAGSFGITDDTGTNAKFKNPQGITTDGTNLYVSDTNNNTIRKIQ